MIWTDRKTGADKDFGSWNIISSLSDVENNITIVPGTFCGHTSHSKPEYLAELNNLKLPQAETVFENNIKPPSPSESMKDNFNSDWIKVRETKIPYNSIKHFRYDVKWNVDQSPFYTMLREDRFILIARMANHDSADKAEMRTSFTTGISKENSTTWSNEFGISITAEAGFSLGVDASLSCTASYSMGYSSTATSSFSTSTTKDYSISVSPKEVMCIFQRESRLSIKDALGRTIKTPINIKLPGVDAIPYKIK